MKTRVKTKLVSVIKRLSGQAKKSQKGSSSISIVGAAVGAFTSYCYAYDTGNSMRDTYKEYYYSEWQ